MIRIRVVEEKHGVHIRSKTFRVGPDADFNALCKAMRQYGYIAAKPKASLSSLLFRRKK
jgi:hypothetical protein